MKTVKYPLTNSWTELIQRPALKKETLNNTVTEILENVQKNGNQALFNYGKLFDKVELNTLEVAPEEINVATHKVPVELKEAIKLAYNNIFTFHSSQREQENIVETSPGIKCWRKSLPIDKVGLYIPGGTAPLFSSILMLGIPAKIAGCSEIILCTPPDHNGEVNETILFTAKLVGINRIFKVGGAQAIAAMAYGTESIPQVYKIFGPGNQYVTKAKELIQQTGVAIDLPAGPSELLVIADETSVPDFVAADLLSQAEHGPDSQVILLSNDETTLNNILTKVKQQLELLPRKEIAEESLSFSKAILLETMEDCIRFSNRYAPEHLIIASENAKQYGPQINNAGSVFLGNYSCESAGDYASGTNHTLPTNGYAKNYSGVSLDSFVKKITFQELNRKGIHMIGNAIELMAEAEGLFAHKNAVTLRLNALENE